MTRPIEVTPRLTILSLGAGVQSSTLALMAAHGEVTPMPDCAIFADTQAEPQAVYRHLDWLESVLPFPIHRVTAGNLRDKIMSGMRGEGPRTARPPFFTRSGGMLRRQCTQDYKLIPIHRKVRELLGLRPKQRGPKCVAVEQWIGISADEASRMKPSRYPYIQNRWPLVEMEITRADCVRWLTDHGYPVPSKSACTFCPYHDDRTWRELQRDPAAWAEALAVDEAIRHGLPGAKRPDDAWFVHRSRQPLADVDLSTPEDRGQLNWINECEGLCNT